MLKKFIKNPYVIAGIVIFILLFTLGVFALEFSIGESMLYSAALAIIGVGSYWWKENVW
ncbi:MAG: hypothetical protein HY867_17450 [Chloroflexi bacterium]|nr:hypothetical protein [Chloroflexota bacterium]